MLSRQQASGLHQLDAEARQDIISGLSSLRRLIQGAMLVVSKIRQPASPMTSGELTREGSALVAFLRRRCRRTAQRKTTIYTHYYGAFLAPRDCYVRKRGGAFETKGKIIARAARTIYSLRRHQFGGRCHRFCKPRRHTSGVVGRARRIYGGCIRYTLPSLHRQSRVGAGGDIEMGAASRIAPKLI